MIGKKYNMLTVVKRVDDYISPSGKQTFRQYLCKCDCGKTVIVLGASLRANHTKSCGCLQKRPKIDDSVMLNKKFGKLTVIKRMESHKIPSGSVYDKWYCICDCGNHTVSFGRNLRNGHNQSCGCERVRKQKLSGFESKAEKWTREFFDTNKIDYEYQKTFPNLFGKNNGLLSYDFYIPDRNVLLELHGLQHYEPVKWFGGEKTFEIQTYHDELKYNYAKNNGYILVALKTNRITKQNLYKKLEKIFSINET